MIRSRTYLGLAIGLTALTFLSFQNCARLESAIVVGDSVLRGTTGGPTSDHAVPDVASPLKMIDPDGFDVIIVAGQSNSTAVGIGTFTDPVGTQFDDKIDQVGRAGADNLKVVPATDALQAWGFVPAMVGTRVAFAMSFARSYARTRLSSNRRVLIIPAGFGGTSLVWWDRRLEFPDDNTIFFDDLIARLDVVKTQPGTHRVVAMLWHQGETDVALLSLAARTPPETGYAAAPDGTQKVIPLGLLSRPADYVVRFRELIRAVREATKTPDLPVLAGEWSERAQAIVADAKAPLAAAIRGGGALEGEFGWVASKGLQTNDDAGYPDCPNNGCSHIHFGAQGMIDFGKRYFDAWVTLRPVLGKVTQSSNSGGTRALSGYACLRLDPRALVVNVYAGSDFVTSVRADQSLPDEDAFVARTCGTTPPHGFIIRLSPTQTTLANGRALDVRAAPNDRVEIKL